VSVLAAYVLRRGVVTASNYLSEYSPNPNLGANACTAYPNEHHSYNTFHHIARDTGIVLS